jgi:hypothetical protein
MQQLQQRFLVGIELLKRLAFDAGNERRDQPLRCSRAVRDLLASKRKCCDMGELHW